MYIEYFDGVVGQFSGGITSHEHDSVGVLVYDPEHPKDGAGLIDGTDAYSAQALHNLHLRGFGERSLVFAGSTHAHRDHVIEQLGDTPHFIGYGGRDILADGDYFDQTCFLTPGGPARIPNPQLWGNGWEAQIGRARLWVRQPRVPWHAPGSVAVGIAIGGKRLGILGDLAEGGFSTLAHAIPDPDLLRENIEDLMEEDFTDVVIGHCVNRPTPNPSNSYLKALLSRVLDEPIITHDGYYRTFIGPEQPAELPQSS